MKIQCFSSIFPAFLTSLSLILASCTPTIAPTQLQATQTPTTIATQTPPPTSTPIATPTRQPSPSFTPTQPAIRFVPTTFEQPGAWTLRHRYSDADAPRLIEFSQDGYNLIPDFQLASIELAFRWVGIGDEVRDYQRIERKGDTFWRGNTEIPASAVAYLVKSINHLLAEPETLSATIHSDDYPFWVVELTSTTGEKILLHSDSNTPDFSPWNVIYNGEIYTQFDGGIPVALSSLFDVVGGQTMASVCGPQEEGYLPTTTIEGPPKQLSAGFNGLMPIYFAFGYYVDAQKGEFLGYLSDYQWTEQEVNAELYWLNEFQAAELEVENQPVACKLENMQQEDPKSIYWRFTCPIERPANDVSYNFPVRLTFSNSSGEPSTISGEVFGYWDNAMTLPATPYPKEIGEILTTSPLTSDLMQDHLVYLDRFFSKVDYASGSMTHVWEGYLALLGQAQVGERVIPYTVSVDQVRIEDGKVVNWNLDRAELEDLLGDVLAQNISQRFLEAEPTGVINLFYYEDYEYPIINPDRLQACAYLPEGKELPAPGQPLRGFSFNQIGFVSNYFNMQFTFIDNNLRVFDMDIHPTTAEDAFWLSLLPAEFSPQDAPAFDRILVSSGTPEIYVVWDTQASAAEISYYNSIFTGWEVEPLEYEAGLSILHTWLDLTPEGGLRLLDCEVQ